MLVSPNDPRLIEIVDRALDPTLALLENLELKIQRIEPDSEFTPAIYLDLCGLYFEADDLRLAIYGLTCRAQRGQLIDIDEATEFVTTQRNIKNALEEIYHE